MDLKYLNSFDSSCCCLRFNAISLSKKLLSDVALISVDNLLIVDDIVSTLSITATKSLQITV